MANDKEKINIGISSCLLGEKVRWNGDHKRNAVAKDIFGKFFNYVSVCPEVEVGMGVPRETVHLRGSKESPQMVATKSGRDWTRDMVRFGKKRAEDLASNDLSGFIFKKGSPSCGISRVSIHSDTGAKMNSMGQGLFATAFTQRFPLVPVEEEGRLNDYKIRENFIVRVFSFHRLQIMFKRGYSRGSLVKFHTAHKFLLLSHSRKHYEILGRLVAEVKNLRPAEMNTRYSEIFMEALTLKSTAKKNSDVLLHMMGFLKKYLTNEDKLELLSTVEDFRKEFVPLIVPVTLIRHYVKKYRITYLLDQVYLNPHPKELMLRNHV